MAPRINQLSPHTHSGVSHCHDSTLQLLGLYHLASSNKWICYNIDLCPVSAGPGKSHLWRVAEEQLLHRRPMWGFSGRGRDIERLPGHALASPAMFIDTQSTSPFPNSGGEASGGEGRQRSAATAKGNHLPLATPWIQPRAAQVHPHLLPASAAAQRLLQEGDGDRASSPLGGGRDPPRAVPGGPPRSYLRGPAVPPSPSSQPPATCSQETPWLHSVLFG